MCPPSLQSILWSISEKRELSACPILPSSQTVASTSCFSCLSAPLPHLLSPGFGPRYLGKKQFFEVTMWPANPAGFPSCDLILLSKFHPLNLQIMSQCFPFSRFLFSQDISPLSSLAPEKALAPHSSTPAWKIPWMEEPGRLQSMGSLRVRHD